MKKLLKNQKGLTLVELLAVIVILGIVAAIAVPTIGGVIAKSKKNGDIASLKMIQDAAVRYSMANENANVTAADGNIQTVLVSGGYLTNFTARLNSKSIDFNKFSVTFNSGTNVYDVVVEQSDGTDITETTIKA